VLLILVLTFAHEGAWELYTGDTEMILYQLNPRCQPDTGQARGSGDEINDENL
jgi:hypothetical protein